MKDIDFDELDRAVSSLMGGTPSNQQKPAEEDDEHSDPVVDSTTATMTTVTTEPSEGASEAPVEAAEVKNDTKSPRVPMQSSSIHSSQPSIASNRRGLYMDMVRPVATPTARPIPVGSAPRQGVTLEPQPFAEPHVTTEEPISTEVSEPAAPIVEQSAVEEVPEPAPTIDLAAELASAPIDEPLTSPFLADAKVEKRPLGRPNEVSDMPDPLANQPAVDPVVATNTADAGATLEDSAENADVSSGDKDAQLPEQPLPAELGSEILTIESTLNEVPTDAPDTPLPAATQPPMPAPVSASIPQQYKVQPKVAEEEPTSAIYDTSTYHQPVATPEKKKPGWLIFAIIGGIALLGVASGIAVYYLGIF